MHQAKAPKILSNGWIDGMFIR